MIRRNRARERVSIPATTKFIYTLGLFADKISQALINHTKFSDDIPELPDFTEFVSTNFIQRVLAYPLDHVGDKWTIIPKVPTSHSSSILGSTVVGVGATLQSALHTGLGRLVGFSIICASQLLEIIVKVDGVEVYRRSHQDLAVFDVSDYKDQLCQISQWDDLGLNFGLICRFPFTFRNTFEVLCYNPTAGALSMRSCRSIAQLYNISW
jgi:hypothetical protein